MVGRQPDREGRIPDVLERLHELLEKLLFLCRVEGGEGVQMTECCVEMVFAALPVDPPGAAPPDCRVQMANMT